MSFSTIDLPALFSLLIGATTLCFMWVRHPRRRASWSVRKLETGQFARVLAVRSVAKSAASYSVAQLVFWNSGNATLKAEHVPERSPLKILAEPPSRIAIATLIHPAIATNYNGVDVQVDPEGKFATLTFTYLNPKQGAVLQLLHTGHYADQLSLRGDLIDTKQFDRKENPSQLFALGALVTVALSPIYFFFPDILVSGPEPYRRIVMAFALVAALYVGIGTLQITLRQPPHDLLLVYEPEGEPVSLLDLIRRSVMR